jgi:Carboxypeptidase regulatory-like domain
MNWKRFFVAMFALLISVVAASQPMWAQATVSSGDIQGTVTDAQGGVVANATVTISNKATGEVTTLTTNSSGTYSSGTLNPATYNVRVQAPSFKVSETTVVVQVGQVSVYNAKLEVGSSSSVVEVSGEAVQVNTDQAQISGTLTTEQIEALPINGRNFLDLAQLEPGVQIQDGGNFDPTKNGFSSISFGGRFGRSARIQVDGVDTSDENVGTTTEDIPASAISEFQVAQSSLDLSNSLTSSGAVNVVTKSGTNAFHGEGFGAFRDSSQAATFPGVGTVFQRSQYGGDFGGAIIKDKLFFFIDGEKILQHQSAGVVVGGPLSAFSGTFPAPYHDGEALGRIDYNISKNIRAFVRFNYFQNADVGAFGGAATYSTYLNEDRTKNVMGGVDFSEGSVTHSFRASYLKFVNVITDSVRGSAEPFADFPVSLSLPFGFASGPSDNAPQSTIQSDREIKYDGSKVAGAHIFRWGVDYNRIKGWSFASFFGFAPLSVNFLNDIGPGAICPGGVTGAGCPLSYLPDEVIIGNGQGVDTELPFFGKPAGGLGPDNRIGIYIGDSWKVRHNLTVTYGLRYVRDTFRSDSDLPAIPQLNAVLPGFGNKVNQPNTNLAPQLGIAWDPKGDGRTVIRAGIGIYYDNTVFNNILFDRSARLATGAFFQDGLACLEGSAFPVTFGDGSQNVIPGGNGTCQTAVGATLPTTAAFGTCGGLSTAQCIANFQGAYQTSFAGTTNSPNSSYIPNLLANNAAVPSGAAFLAPDYRSPQSLQMNVGFQRELRAGMVLSVDYLRNVGTHYLLSTDVNHSGDTAYFDVGAAQTAITSTLAACGAASINAAIAPAGCPGLHPASGTAPAGSAVMADFAGFGLDSAADLGVGNCTANIGAKCAFSGVNPAVGAFPFLQPIGRSVYNGLDFKLVQNAKNPFRGVKYLNFQATYTLSRFDNAGSGTSGAAVSGGDQDFITAGLDNRNPLRFTGPSALDRTHQFSFGGYADLPKGFRLGVISHLWSPLSTTPTIPVSSSAGAIYTNDWTGSGTTSEPLPKSVTGGCGTFGGSCDYTTYNVGSFARNLNAGGLNNAINNYNTTIGGILPTPAGQVLINNSLFTLAQLQALGGVASPAVPVTPGQVNMAWFRGTDMEFSYVGHIKERFTLTPSVSFFNIFNFANFDSAGNALVGTLNGTAGTINGTVSDSNPLSPGPRPDRIGVGSGAFNFGSPRVIEWGLKLQF